MPALLYGTLSVQDEVVALLTYMDRFTGGLGIPPLEIDLDAVARVVRSVRQDFPHKDGVDKASVFKKAAHFLTYFVATAPIQSSFPEGAGWLATCGLQNHENAVLAFEMAVDFLHNATVHRTDGAVVKLSNRIVVSAHSYVDIIDALSNVSPVAHFKTTTVLLEQLAYRANPEASYPLMDS